LSMYRIELGPDDIGVFRSIDELATAIKTGVITSKARIYHSASDKWLPIEFHPHFKKAREMAAGPVPPAPPAPPRVDSGPVRVRTPLPPPSPVAGLPLIDVSAPPAPHVPAPPRPEPELREPEPAPPALNAPASVALVAAPAQPPVPEYETASPPPAAHYEPALYEPVAAQYEAPAAHYEVASEPDPAPEPIPAVPLPEPERDAIFLSAPVDPMVEATADWEEPVAVGEASEHAPEAVVVEEEPRVAAPMPAFQLPRVDLRLRERRRPILIAAAAATLAVSTHFALQNGAKLASTVSLPIPDLRPKDLSAEGSQTPASTNASVLPASVPAKGSPSFGGASAFATPNPVVENVPPPPPADTAPAPVAAIAPPPKIAIAAPKIAVPSLEGDLKTASGLVARYDGAYAAARSELDNGLKTAGFANLFAIARLQPEGLRAARASVGTASAYVQRYRRREAEIEQAYRDTFNLLATGNKWSDGQRRTWDGRKIARENSEIVKLSSFLLQSLDSLYGLLAAHEGGYRVSDGSIAFDDAAAARAYAELRPWLDRRAHAWADTAGDEPTTAARILRAMGTVKLPDGEGI
jgi:hypothetical protein